MTAFLTHLAAERIVSASTQSQARAALLFLCREVLGVDLPWLDEVVGAKPSRHLLVVLTPREVERLFKALSGAQWQVASGQGFSVHVPGMCGA